MAPPARPGITDVGMLTLGRRALGDVPSPHHDIPPSRDLAGARTGYDDETVRYLQDCASSRSGVLALLHPPFDLLGGNPLGDLHGFVFLAPGDEPSRDGVVD